MNLSGSGIGWGSPVSDPFFEKAGEGKLDKNSVIRKCIVCTAG